MTHKWNPCVFRVTQNEYTLKPIYDKIKEMNVLWHEKSSEHVLRTIYV